jgi:hypothetical protein
LGKGVLNLTQTLNKFFKIEKAKALINTNKAVKDFNSTPSFNFVLNSTGNSKGWGILRIKPGEKRLVWLGKQPIFGLYKEGFFGPETKSFFYHKGL